MWSIKDCQAGTTPKTWEQWGNPSTKRWSFRRWINRRTQVLTTQWVLRDITWRPNSKQCRCPPTCNYRAQLKSKSAAPSIHSNQSPKSNSPQSPQNSKSRITSTISWPPRRPKTILCNLPINFATAVRNYKSTRVNYLLTRSDFWSHLKSQRLALRLKP